MHAQLSFYQAWRDKEMTVGSQPELLKEASDSLDNRNLDPANDLGQYLTNTPGQIRRSLNNKAVTTQQLQNEFTRLEPQYSELSARLVDIEQTIKTAIQSYNGRIQEQKIKDTNSTNVSSGLHQDLIDSVRTLTNEADELYKAVHQDIERMPGIKPGPDLSGRLKKLTGHLDNLAAKSQELGEKSKALDLEVIYNWDEVRLGAELGETARQYNFLVEVATTLIA